MLILRGQDRHQMQFYTLADRIAPDNPVRFVDAFVYKIEPDKLGFAVPTVKTEGRPAYESKLFLKVYLYGYLNGIRSSRMWSVLMNKQPYIINYQNSLENSTQSGKVKQIAYSGGGEKPSKYECIPTPSR